MNKKRFSDDPSTCVFTSRFVLEEDSLVVFVSHDADGDWQFLGDQTDLIEKDARLISLEEMIGVDPTILEIADLPLGWIATRRKKGDRWQIKPKPSD